MSFLYKLFVIFTVGINVLSQTKASTDFVFTLPEPNIRGGQIYLLVTTTSSNPINVSVDVPSISFNNQSVLWRDMVANISIPHNSNIYPKGTDKQDKAFSIHSEGEIFVHAVYTHDVYRSTGISLIPTSQLGRTYFIPSYTPATRPDLEWSEFTITSLGVSTKIDIFEAGYKSTIFLAPYRSYQLQSINDLTGTKIVADQPVSVMSGTSASHVGHTRASPEYIVQHVPPVNHLGTSYVLAPLIDRSSGYVFRVIATEPRTQVNITDVTETIVISPGDFYEMDADTTKAITTDKPVLVAQYSKSLKTDDFGDAFMLIVPPLHKFPKGDISFPVTTLAKSEDLMSYLSIITSCEHQNLIHVDGTSINSDRWDILRVNITQTTYCVFRRHFDHGVHHIATPGGDVPFEAIVYGFSSSVAYAFTLWGLPSDSVQSRDLSRVTWLSCKNSTMEIYINSSYVSSGVPADVHLLDSSCVGEFYDDSYIRLRTEFDNCGTTAEMSNDNFIFRNKLIYTSSNSNDTVSLNIDLSCTVPRRGNSSFGPILSSITGDTNGFGYLIFSLQMFQGSSYRTAFHQGDFPIIVDEGQNVFLAASVSKIEDVKLFIEMCKTTPSDDPNDPVQNVIIDNGCGKDNPMTLYESPNNSQLRFSTTLGNRFSAKPKSMLYIHCSMIACIGDNSDLCPEMETTNCHRIDETSQRTRRDMKSIGPKESFKRVMVSVGGPVEIRAKRAQPSQQSTAYVSAEKMNVTLGFCLGVSVLIIIVGLLIKIRKIAKNRRSVDSDKDTLVNAMEMEHVSLGLKNLATQL